MQISDDLLGLAIAAAIVSVLLLASASTPSKLLPTLIADVANER
jgi:hypothetical protein